MLKRVLAIGGALVGCGAAVLGIYVIRMTSAFDASMERVYDVPIPGTTRSTDPAVIARGKHLVESLGACSTRDCHGADLGGGATLQLGPLGTLSGPNITPGGIGVAYSDGELARLLMYGIKRDGRGIRLMPAQDFGWLPDPDDGDPYGRVNALTVLREQSGALGDLREAAVCADRAIGMLRVRDIEAVLAPAGAPVAIS